MNAADERDNLGAFLKFADDLKEIRDHYERPAWAQTCPCGGTVEVSKHIPAAERRRIALWWWNLHRDCTRTVTDLAPILGQIGETP